MHPTEEILNTDATPPATSNHDPGGGVLSGMENNEDEDIDNGPETLTSCSSAMSSMSISLSFSSDDESYNSSGDKSDENFPRRNKTKTPRTLRRISRPTTTSTSIPSLTTVTALSTSEFFNSATESALADPSTTSFSDAPEEQEDNEELKPVTPTVRVLEALVRFQTSLSLLTNSVGSLHETINEFIPEVVTSQPSSSAMPGVVSRPFKRSLSFSLHLQNEISPPENNNVIEDVIKKDVTRDGSQDEDTVLDIPSSTVSASLDTVTTDLGCSTDISICDEETPEEKQQSKDDVSSEEEKQVSCFRGCAGACPRVFVQYAGIILALFASLCMSLVSLVVKFMEGYHPVSKVVWRLQGVLLPSLGIVLYVWRGQRKPLFVWANGEKKWGKIMFLLIIRGIVGCSADIFQYYSLSYLPLADSTTISFSTPIFVSFLACCVLKEKLGFVPLFTAILTFFGVLVITRPPFLTGGDAAGFEFWLGNGLAVCCMFCATITTVIMRYLKDVHFAMTMLALGVVGTIEGCIVTIFTEPLELPAVVDSYDMSLAAFAAGLFFFGQLAQTLALKLEEAGVVSLVRTCDVIFAFVWQVNLLHEKADIYSYIGGFIVTVGVCIIALRRWVSEKKENHPVRRRLAFILK